MNYIVKEQLTTDGMHLVTICMFVSPYQQILLLCHNSVFVSVDTWIGYNIDPLVTLDDVMTVISELNNLAAGHDDLLKRGRCREWPL